MFKVLTVNVNGIRATKKNGGVEWLESAGIDVMCLQEVRATHEQLHEAIAGSTFASWHVSHSPASELGRSGVAVLSREQPSAVRVGFNSEEFDHQGRWIEVDLDSPVGPLTVVSVYVPTGDADKPLKQAEKYRFLDAMDARLAALATRASRTKRQVIVTGDFNVGHTELDIKNWKGNLKKAGFLEDERAHFDTWFARDRWVDLHRRFAGEVAGPYTWWSWRGQAFDNDAGWRIDYLIATKALAEQCRDVVVGRAASYDTRWSDHAPVIATFGR